MTTTDLARRPSAAVAVRIDTPAPVTPVTYRLVNPWRKAVAAAGGLSVVALAGSAVATRVDLNLLPHATGASVGSLALFLAATGMHSRFQNRVKSRDKFVAIKP